MTEVAAGRTTRSPARARRRRVLVVDDAEGIRTYLANFLELKGYAVDTAEDGRRALALLQGGAAPDVILLDIMMPGIDGLETLRRIRDLDDRVPVVMLSVVGKASTIVEAMQLGAADYLNKPFEEEEFEATLDKVLEGKRLEEERDQLLAQLDAAPTQLWSSAPMRRILEVIDQIADTDVTVLIQGESGVGKEIVARTIHERSPRAARPFIKVNCASLPEPLLESELFGYEKGAFTGALSRKPGRFEMADTGTIFLDEIGEMSPALQAKLLQVLQDSEYTRLGGNREVRVDIRVLCATNRPLEQMVQEGGFREDLFFRLNVVNINVPPLRERRDEIQALAESFARRYAARYEKPCPEISERILRAFDRYAFPGNVRELENLVKRMVVLESEAPILEDLRVGERGAGSSVQELIDEVASTAGELPLREVGRRVSRVAERETIERVLARTGWNRKQAARLLGVSYKTLLQKIKDCGLEPDA
ncbi:MAG: sigma-54-dependent Fis family transcriptional regulator [Deltaproteobacteria bacterium]|nr:MAG: sigma-54-dependent Fis family transcriptional regulator [Deltaproteobacteria bacterium]